jgi:hypothetical protein
MTVKHLLFLATITFTTHLVPMQGQDPLHEIFPNEVVRMFLEHMVHWQRMSVARVSPLWRFLVASFPPPPPLSPLVKINGHFCYDHFENMCTIRQHAQHSELLQVRVADYDIGGIETAVSCAKYIGFSGIERIRVGIDYSHESLNELLGSLKKIIDANQAKEGFPAVASLMFPRTFWKYRSYRGELCEKREALPSLTELCFDSKDMGSSSFIENLNANFVENLKRYSTNIDTVELWKDIRYKRTINGVQEDKVYEQFLTTCSDVGIRRLKGLIYSDGLCNFIKKDSSVEELHIDRCWEIDVRSVIAALHENRVIRTVYFKAGRLSSNFISQHLSNPRIEFVEED